jgi:hypothetical protein
MAEVKITQAQRPQEKVKSNFQSNLWQSKLEDINNSTKYLLLQVGECKGGMNQ